jgi:hypothetical protein
MVMVDGGLVMLPSMLKELAVSSLLSDDMTDGQTSSVHREESTYWVPVRLMVTPPLIFVFFRSFDHGERKGKRTFFPVIVPKPHLNIQLAPPSTCQRYIPVV